MGGVGRNVASLVVTEIWSLKIFKTFTKKIFCYLWMVKYSLMSSVNMGSL